MTQHALLGTLAGMKKSIELKKFYLIERPLRCNLGSLFMSSAEILKLALS